MSEIELYTDVAFMYILLLGILFLAVILILPRLVLA